MKKSICTNILFGCMLLCILSSCSKEEPMMSHASLTDLERAEIYLENHSVPAIMFSYDVLNTDTKVMTRLLIDSEGQIRQHTEQAFSARSNQLVSPVYLQNLKDESSVVEDVTVTLEELVQNFSLLRTADGIEYDSSVEQPGPQVLKAMYGYYFDAGTTYTSTSSSSSGNNCGDGSSSTTTTTSTTSGSSFRSVLLEQKLGEDIIQSNLGAKFTATWFNELNASLQDIFED